MSALGSSSGTGSDFGTMAGRERRRVAAASRAATAQKNMADGMVNTECAALVAGERERMTARFAAFHMADRALKAHVARWSIEGRAYLAPLNAFYDAQMAAAHPSHVPEEVRAAGEMAERICQAANERKLAMMARRHELLTAALVSMGAHHGYAMASDPRGSVKERFVRHIRRMGMTLRAHMPSSRVVGMEHDFPSAIGWSKAMGFKGGKELMEAMRMGGVTATCRLA